jgi:hypothetical protein
MPDLSLATLRKKEGQPQWFARVSRIGFCALTCGFPSRWDAAGTTSDACDVRIPNKTRGIHPPHFTRLLDAPHRHVRATTLHHRPNQLVRDRISTCEGGVGATDSTEDATYVDVVGARWPALFRTACLLTGDHERVEEALQATLVKAYAKWRNVFAADSVDAYVRRMLANEVLGVRR